MRVLICIIYAVNYPCIEDSINLYLRAWTQCYTSLHNCINYPCIEINIYISIFKSIHSILYIISTLWNGMCVLYIHWNRVFGMCKLPEFEWLLWENYCDFIMRLLHRGPILSNFGTVCWHISIVHKIAWFACTVPLQGISFPFVTTLLFTSSKPCKMIQDRYLIIL